MNVLVMGLRKSVLSELDKKGIAYALWADQETKLKAPLGTAVAPMHSDREELRKFIKTHWPSQSFSHVIATTEGAVYPASLARRIVHARLSEKTMVLHCRDKILMKQYLRYFDIPMTRFIDGSRPISVETIVEKLDFPVVVKDRDQSGGRGLVFAKTIDELKSAMHVTRIYEKMVNAPEGSIESFIQNGQIQFTNITQYRSKTHVNIVPAPYPDTECQQILELNESVVKALKIQWGQTHLEFYRSAEGHLFGEIALRPPGGYIMDLISMAYGFNAWEAFIAVELGIDFIFPKKSVTHAGVYIVHPGPGVLEEISGVEELKSQPWVSKLKMKALGGQQLAGRESVREELGHIIFTAPTAEELEQRLLSINSKLKLKVAGQEYHLPLSDVERHL
ncbi:MAG: ATP-grasp domain-containing protein [Bdellovibrionales bacterium]|nr:ATP-grasp domain-containing protein [Bdellovibrionales bacterium]